LLGWLKQRDGSTDFDRQDVYGNGLSGIDSVPGDRVTARFSLERRIADGVVQWVPRGETEPMFIYEAWSQHERDERRFRHDGGDESRGHRLMIRVEALAQFLQAEGFELITEVGVSRRDKKRPHTHDEEEAHEVEVDRVYLLRADGRREAADRGIGSWRTNRT
jgi:hypothetical protein